MIFIISITVLAVAYALDVAFAWLMQELFDSVGSKGSLGLSELLTIFVVLFIVAVIAQLIFRAAHSRFVKKAMFQYKKTAMDKLLRDSVYAERLGIEAVKIQKRLAPDRVNFLWKEYFDGVMGR